MMDLQGVCRAHREREDGQRATRRYEDGSARQHVAVPTRSALWSMTRRAKGARVLAGGERGDGGFFFQPTLLADVPTKPRS